MILANAEFLDYRHSVESISLLRELAGYELRYKPNHRVVSLRDDVPKGMNALRFAPSSFHITRQIEWPWVIMQAELTPDLICLDVGGGGESYLFAIANRIKKLVAVEKNKENIELTIRGTAEFGLADKVEVLDCDGAELPHPDDCFDRVFCVSVIEHAANRQAVVEELIRVLKPGGIGLLTMDVKMGDYPATGEFVSRQECHDILMALGATGLDIIGPGIYVVGSREGDFTVVLCRFTKTTNGPQKGNA